MPSAAVVDAGPLLAALDRGSDRHADCLEVLERGDLALVVPALIVTEVCQIAGRRLGADVEAEFLRGLSGFDVRQPHPDDWRRIAELVDTYRDWPLGGADASVVALAERVDADVVLTLDHRHFGAVRPRHATAFTLLP